MAIVDGKRHEGFHFYKLRGVRRWVAYDDPMRTLYGPCADFVGDDPMVARFHYCSPISQPVFIDGGHHPGFPDHKHYVASSWKKMPECWRAIFRRDVFGNAT